MNNDIHSAAAKGFQIGTDAYERGRPEYPMQSVERLSRELGLAAGKVVLDLGAGTGKFTKLLTNVTPAHIIAIEPVESMRNKFATLLPAIEILDGTAEKIPLADGSADAVVVAQAFHWFNGEKAIKEIHRVLKPNGTLGMVWNVRDESKKWVAQLTEIIDPHEGGAPRYKSGSWKFAFESTNLFTTLQAAQFNHVHASTPEMIVDRVASISFISALNDVAKNKVLDEVRTVLRTSEETKDKPQIDFPYRTDIFWCKVGGKNGRHF